MFRRRLSRTRIALLTTAAAATVGGAVLAPVNAGAQANEIATLQQATQQAALQTQASALATALLTQTPQAPQVPDPSKSVPTLDVYQEFLKKMVDLIDGKASQPDGSKSQRETAFETLAAIDLAMISGLIVLPTGTGLLGGGIGLVVGAAAGGFGGAPIADAGGATLVTGMLIGTGAGAAIGTGAGALLSMAGVIAATVITITLAMYINDHYPPDKQTASTGVRIASAGNFGFAPQAGPFESLVINLIDVIFTDKMKEIGSAWDAAPGLTAQQKAFLSSHNALRPFFQQLAYILANHRFSPTSPVAQPLSGWMKESVLLLSADSAAVEKAWLSALGAGEVSAKIRSGKLTLGMPPALTAVGMPATVSADLSGLNLKVGGNGGALDPYLSVSVAPGPFDLTAGSASVVDSGPNANRIKVTYVARRGSTLGGATFRWKWNGPEATLAAFTPALADDLAVTLFFKPDGVGLSLDKVDIAGFSVSLNLPAGLPNNIPGLSDLLNQLSKGLQDGLKAMVSGQSTYMTAFNSMQTHQAASLRNELNANARTYGMFSVASVQGLQAQGGKLKASVRGQVIDSAKLPKVSITSQQVASSFNHPTFPRRPGLPTIPLLPSLQAGSR